MKINSSPKNEPHKEKDFSFRSNFVKVHQSANLSSNDNENEKSPSNYNEVSSLIFEKKDLNNQKTNSIFVSSFYSSEDERKKQETFERKLEYLSDEKYFMKVKEEKSPLKLKQKTDKTYHSDQYIELNDISRRESCFRKTVISFAKKFERGEIIPTIFLLMSSTIGASFLLANTSFQENNFFLSFFSYVICGCLSYYSTNLLIESCHKCKRFSYAGLSEACDFPFFITFFFKLIFFLFNLSVIAIYSSMMGNIISSFLQSFMDTKIDNPGYGNLYFVLIIIIVMGVLIFPMSVFREFNKLRFGCIIGNLFLVFIVSCMMYLSIFGQKKHEENRENYYWLDYLNHLFFPIFAFSCHNTVPDIFQESKESPNKLTNMNISLIISTTISLVIYVLMGNFCLINLDHQENIKPYLENQPLIIRVDIFIFALYLIFILPINMKPCKESLLYLLDPKSGRDSYKHHLLFTGLCGCFAIIISLFQEATRVVLACSSVITTLVCFVMPAVFYVRIVWKKNKVTLKIICLFLLYIIFIPVISFLSTYQSFQTG